MKRGKFLNLMGVAAFSPVYPGLWHGGKEKEGSGYNLLIIHTDEHNFRTLGCYRRVLNEKDAFMWGPTVVDTPHIDSIANRGLTADACYCASPICGPSRASFISGLYPMDAGVIENDVPLRPSVESFAQSLAREGYVTGYAGKWHLDGSKAAMEKRIAKQTGKAAKNFYAHTELYDSWVPPSRGMGFTDTRYMFDFGHFKKIQFNPDKNHPDVFPPSELGDEKTFTTDWLTDRALEFIQENREKRFCYMISYPDPHGPDLVREPYYSMYKGRSFKTPYTANLKVQNAPSWAEPVNKPSDDAAYFGMVKCIDDNVGKLLQKLEESDLTKNTIVVFTSDHGDMRGEHGRQDKGVPFEASARIPFVIAAPGLIPENTRTEAAISTIDFKPTILGLMGVSPSQASHGTDMSPVLMQGQNIPDKNHLVFSRSPGFRESAGWLMAVGNGYKLIASAKGPLWLIDLENDPAERTNLASHPEMKHLLSFMAKELIQYAIKYRDPNLKIIDLRNSLEVAINN